MYIVKEMSFPRDKVMDRLETEHYYPMLDNIIKIYYWKNTTTLNHWKQELFNSFNKIDLIKKNKGKDIPPTKNEIIEHLLNTNIDTFDKKIKTLIKNVCVDENQFVINPTEHDMEMIKGFLIEYIETIAGMFSNDVLVLDREKTYQFMDVLIEKYK